MNISAKVVVRGAWATDAGASVNTGWRMRSVRRLSLISTFALLACSGGDNTPDASVPLPDSNPDARPAIDEAVWTVPAPYGFEGSVTVCDLDADGNDEVIIPLTSSLDANAPKATIWVLDAQTGQVVWQAPEGVGGFATPFCVDVNNDNVLDVLVGGRTSDVEALSGVDGSRLWSLEQNNPGILAGNTYSSVAESETPSVLFVTAGGGGAPEIGEPDIVGKLVAYDTGGSILATWQEPNGSETYSSPAVARVGAELLVAVGFGGERLPGRLTLLVYDENMQTFSVRFSSLSACGSGGFVASPMFGDLDGDSVPELVATDYCGVVRAVDLTGAGLWAYQSDVLFGTSNPVLADFDDDGILDVAAAFESLNFSFFPNTSANPQSHLVAIKGTSGALLWERRVMGPLIFASLGTAHFDGDTTEDVWALGSGPPLAGVPALEILSGSSGAVLQTILLGNTSGAPVFGDFDQNGSLDMLGTEQINHEAPAFIYRLEFTGIPFSAAESFSGFRGHPLHDGYRQ